MSIAIQSSVTPTIPQGALASLRQSPEPGFQVIRRNGAVTPFDAGKISIALTKAAPATAAPFTSRTFRTRSNWR
jgi:ribonucleoside-diphosphate reductase alpha chain